MCMCAFDVNMSHALADEAILQCSLFKQQQSHQRIICIPIYRADSSRRVKELRFIDGRHLFYFPSNFMIFTFLLCIVHGDQ